MSCSVQLASDELEALAADDKTSDDVLGRCSLICWLVEELPEEPVLSEHHTLPKENIWMKNLGDELGAERLIGLRLGG